MAVTKTEAPAKTATVAKTETIAKTETVAETEAVSKPGDVVLRSSADVAGCKLLGTATGKARTKWLNSRNDKSVAIEVLKRARNEAADIGGNVMVEKTALLNNSQTFSVYSCP